MLVCVLFTGCKKSEDEAIAIVNACKKNEGGRILVSNFRSFMELEEEYHDEAGLNDTLVLHLIRLLDYHQEISKKTPRQTFSRLLMELR